MNETLHLDGPTIEPSQANVEGTLAGCGSRSIWGSVWFRSEDHTFIEGEGFIKLPNLDVGLIDGCSLD